MPWLDYLLFKNPVLVWLETQKIIEYSTFSVMPFARKQIAERSNRLVVPDENGEATGDLLDRMLALKENNPEVVNDTEITKVCAMLVFAGSDTRSGFPPPSSPWDHSSPFDMRLTT
jgi:cytochrome P450